jgi:hypothetical protein
MVIHTPNIPKNNLFGIFVQIILQDEKHLEYYIANISKDEHTKSGQNALDVAEVIAKELGFKRTWLHDGSSVFCGKEEISLQTLKIIKGEFGWYHKNGYRLPQISMKYIKGLYDRARNLECREVFDNLRELSGSGKPIGIRSVIGPYPWHYKTYYNIEIPLRKMKKFIKKHKCPEEKFFDYLIELHKKSCKDYADFVQVLSFLTLYNEGYVETVVFKNEKEVVNILKDFMELKYLFYGKMSKKIS